MNLFKTLLVSLALVFCTNSATASVAPAKPMQMAMLRGSFSASAITGPYDNACGNIPAGQRWCVDNNLASASYGWTIVTASAKTNAGTACSTSSSTTDETCIVAVDTVSGNDGTCRAQSAPAGNYTNLQLSTFSPTLPCATLAAGYALLRSTSADWLALKKGQTWAMGISGTSNDVWAKNGNSASQPVVLTAYGAGARPIITSGTSQDLYCMETSGGNGANFMVLGIACDNQKLDPNSPNYIGATITADTGVANCGAATTICNINGGAGLPANVISSTNYSINGNGINNLSPTVALSVGATSLTMSGSATYTATQMKLQLQTRMVKAGIFLNGKTNFFYAEDNKINFGNINIQTNANLSPQPTMFAVGRRNMFYSGAANGANFFISPNCPTSPLYVGCTGVSILLEENASNYGAWNPNIWAYAQNGLFHTWYLHDPSVPVKLHGNSVGNNAADNQFRDGGTSINNLFYRNATALATNLEDNNTSISYDVVEAGSDILAGIRTATVTATSGTVLSFDGALSVFSGSGVVNLSNPGSIPSTTAISGIRDGFSVNLNAAIQAGVRGNGVQVGDTIEVRNQGRGGGISVNATGLYLDAGPATNGVAGVYAGPSTGVTVSSATPAIVAETSAIFARSQDEPFQFTSGTLPSGGQLALNTTYCADPANGTATAYPVYAATAGACTGGTNIATTGTAGSGLARTGSRKFTFATHNAGTGWPIPGIPAWVTVGMSVFATQAVNAAYFPQTISGQAGGTTVQSISLDRFTVITTDASILQINGSNPLYDGQATLMFGLPNNANYPTARIGPNNVFVRGGSQAGQQAAALELYGTTSGNNLSQNYIYNWEPRSTGNNTKDSGFPSTNLPAVGSSQILNSGTTASPDVRFPNANIEAYDAANNGSGFNGTITGAATYNPGSGLSYDGATITVNSGTPPAIFDMVFCLTCAQYLTVVSGSGSTYTVSAPAGTLVNVSARAMTNGSFAHYIAQALTQSHETGWSTVWNAAPANNSIRSAIKCGDQVTFPGSPTCSQQNFLLKRDLDPPSNDNDPMWLEKAA